MKSPEILGNLSLLESMFTLAFLISGRQKMLSPGQVNLFKSNMSVETLTWVYFMVVSLCGTLGDILAVNSIILVRLNLRNMDKKKQITLV